MRGRRRAVLGAALTLALSACSPAAPLPSGTPPSTPAATTATPLTRAQASRIPDDGLPVEHALVVPGLAGVTAESMKPPYLSAQYPQIQGEPGLNARVVAHVNQLQAAYRADAGGSDRSELNIVWSLASQDAQRRGFMIAARRSNGLTTSVSYRTLVLDEGTDVTRSSEEYVRAGMRRELVRQLGRTMVASGLPVVPQPENLPLQLANAVLDGLAIDDAGNLVVAVDSGTVAPASVGAVAVRIPAEQARRYLTDEGLRWLDGVSSSYASLTPVGGSPSPRPPRSTESTAIAAPDAAVDCGTLRCVALTFDDGPGPQTAEVVDALDRVGVRGTFFMIGSNVLTDPELVKRMARQGHAIGNHTWDHRLLTALDPATAMREVDRTCTLLEQVTGERPTMLRPPYNRLDKATPSHGMAFVLSSVDAGDWEPIGKDEVIKRVLAGVKDGAIVELRASNPGTLQALPELIADLQRQGYTLARVPDLLGGSMQAGVTYRSRG